MKRRTKRDLGILFGAAAILGSVVFFNITINRTTLAAEMDKLRRQVEGQRRQEGLNLLSWTLVRTTKGSPKRGGTFHEDLKAFDGRHVNIIGFMVPQEQFRDVTEFLLLPLPIECYFCQMPPARDVMLVQLKAGETTPIFEEPVLINGVLNIHEGPGNKFLYSIKEAKLGPGEMGGGLSKKRLELQHMLPKHEQDPANMLDPYIAPEQSE